MVLRPELGHLQEASMEKPVQEPTLQGHRTWDSKGAGVETALFVSVQAVMLVCIVLVAAKLFATL
jgi:hypothetical protein